MRVLIATPCNQGQAGMYFMASFNATDRAFEVPRQFLQRDFQQLQRALANPHEFTPAQLDTAKNTFNQMAAVQPCEVGLYTLGNESLLARGRNHCAQRAMVEGWDKLFFIDADEGWTPQQFHKIITSPFPITGGLVPLKTFPIVLNHLPFKKDMIFCEPYDGLKTPESLWATSDHYKSNYVKVAMIGTGFMCIDVKKVLVKLAETTPQYQYPHPATGYNETHWAFFDGGPIGDEYYSEDWNFCERARRAGFDIVVDSDVIVTHTGQWTFTAPPRPPKAIPEEGISI